MVTAWLWLALCLAIITSGCIGRASESTNAFVAYCRTSTFCIEYPAGDFETCDPDKMLLAMNDLPEHEQRKELTIFMLRRLIHDLERTKSWQFVPQDHFMTDSFYARTGAPKYEGGACSIDVYYWLKSLPRSDPLHEVPEVRSMMKSVEDSFAAIQSGT